MKRIRGGKTGGLSLLFYWAVRVLLAVTFLFSGMVKAIDPKGTAYKIEEYIHYFIPGGFDYRFEIALICSFLLCAVEFVLGIYLFFGVRRRLTAWVTVGAAVVFSAVSVFVWVYHPVSDCGCFGDAVPLTAGQTLVKNAFLLLLACLYMRSYERTDSFIPSSIHWLVSLYSLVFILGFSLLSSWYLPMLDFRPYKVGVDMSEARASASVSEMLKAEDISPLMDFYVTDSVGNDVTDGLLDDSLYQFWLVLPGIQGMDDSHLDEINVINDFCEDRGYPFVILTAATRTELSRWMDFSGLVSPVYFADGTLLKTMIRSNPGLMLVRKGVILAKWSCNNLPQERDLVNFKRLEQDRGNSALLLLKIILYYFIPLIFITFAVKLRRQYRTTIRQKKMRKKIVAGNWKMNTTLQEGVALAKEINASLEADKPNCEVIVCTPFIHLASVAGVIDTKLVKLGAENCADKEKGAYTGEVSAEMVKSTGAEYVILGHSERRAYYGETAEILKEKVKLALANGLKIIFCIGEVLEEREANKQNEVVGAQLAGSLFDLTAEELSNIVLAYEPVWAIGTGKTATADQAEEMHAFIRKTIADKFGADAAENISILYGGSCKPANAKEIFSKPDVDGGLIGGAALKADSFKGIIDAWK